MRIQTLMQLVVPLNHIGTQVVLDQSVANKELSPSITLIDGSTSVMFRSD